MMSLDKYLIRLKYLLALVMFFKLMGFFTLSESIAITRVIKIILRVSMTAIILLIYRDLSLKGFIPSFKLKNSLAYFFYLLYLFLGFASLLYTSDVFYSTLQLFMTSETFLFCILYIKVVLMIQFYHFVRLHSQCLDLR